MPFRTLFQSKKERQARGALITGAVSLLDLLEEVNKYPSLYLNQTILQKALFRYEHRWIPLLACVPPSERLLITPPLDVHWVWLCHMLNPLAYIRDSAAMWQTIRPGETDFLLDHHLPPAADREDARRRAALIWTELYPDESFHILQTLRNAPIRDGGEHRNHDSKISYDIIAASERQMAFYYQVSMPHHRDHNYLKHSVWRYKDMFLKMFKQAPGEVWVPTYDIDLIWHVHMMHPVWYREYTSNLCGTIVPHDDTLNDRSDGSQLNVRWEATISLWKSMFRSKPIVRDGGMWRGNITVEEVLERSRIQKYMQNVENRIITTEKRSSTVADTDEKSEEISFSVIHDNGATLGDMQPNRVHAFEWQTANRPTTQPTDRKPNKFEGVAYLKYGDHPNLLACRTLHFLKYDAKSQPYDYSTVLEVFGVGVSSEIPLATAHYMYSNSISRDKTMACSQKSNEIALLLRVAGEDYGILYGRWVNFEAPRRGTDLRKGTRGSRGRLMLDFWKLGNGSDGTRHRIERIRPGDEPGNYILKLPVVKDDGRFTSSPVKFDIGTAGVAITDVSHAVPAFLLSMAAAALHVTLQPRYAPKSWKKHKIESTMFPEWSYSQEPYAMLRATGGEVKGASGYGGFWNMVMLSLPITPFRDFAGSIHEIRAPEGSVPGGCGGCGGGELPETIVNVL